MGIATSQKSLNVLCPSFDKSGQMPKKHTGFFADISPYPFRQIHEGIARCKRNSSRPGRSACCRDFKIAAKNQIKKEMHK